MIEKAITEAQKIAIHCHSNYFYAVLFRFTETITATLNCCINGEKYISSA